MAQLIRYVEDLHGTGTSNMLKSMDKIFEEYMPVNH
jgi:hypothetical protein